MKKTSARTVAGITASTSRVALLVLAFVAMACGSTVTTSDSGATPDSGGADLARGPEDAADRGSDLGVVDRVDGQAAERGDAEDADAAVDQALDRGSDLADSSTAGDLRAEALAGDAEDSGDSDRSDGADVRITGDAPSEAPPDAGTDAATEGPDASQSDAADAGGAPDQRGDDGGGDAGPLIGCGNGLLDPGESCEAPGPLCRGCSPTFFVSCLAAHGLVDNVCTSLSGVARVSCDGLLNCLVDHPSCLGPVILSPPKPGRCYCSDDACSTGADGPCANAYQALVGAGDPSVVLAQIETTTSVPAHVYDEARNFMDDIICINPSYGGDRAPPTTLRMTEVDYGMGTADFVEILNATGSPVDLTSYRLDFWVRDPQMAGNFIKSGSVSLSAGGVLPDNHYLVIGDPSVTVPSASKKIDFAMLRDDIDNNLADVVLSSGNSTIDDFFNDGPLTGSFCQSLGAPATAPGAGWHSCPPSPGR